MTELDKFTPAGGRGTPGMTDEMVERVARAMAAAFHDADWDVIPEDSDDGTMCRLDYRIMARAAIEAMGR